MQRSLLSPGRTAKTILLVVLVLSGVACGSTKTAVNLLSTKAAHSPQGYKVEMLHDSGYGPLPGENLDLCFPTNASSLRPGVILIHGGGWAGGNQSTNDGFCSSLASQGFVA